MRENKLEIDNKITTYEDEINNLKKQLRVQLNEVGKKKDQLEGVMNENRLLKERLRIFEK
jgi:hypothetical protein